MPAVSGYRGKVLIDGKMFRANRWSVEYNLETDDGTSNYGIPDSPFDNDPSKNNLRLPTKTYYAKYVDISVTVEAYYDTVHGFFSKSGIKDGTVDPTDVYLVPGRKIGIKLYPAKDITGKEDAFWEFKELLITAISHTSEVRGVVKFTLTGKNNSKDYTFDKM